MTTIRRMNADDATAVADLLASSWRRTYEATMGVDKLERAIASWGQPQSLARESGDEEIIAFVAEEDGGAIVGHAMAFMKDDRSVWLERLHVAPGRFGTGLAADLLHAVLAAHAGLPSIGLEVLEGNDRAIRFYEKHGFVVVERKNACGSVDGVPTLVMRKILPRA